MIKSISPSGHNAETDIKIDMNLRQGSARIHFLWNLATARRAVYRLTNTNL